MLEGLGKGRREGWEGDCRTGLDGEPSTMSLCGLVASWVSLSGERRAPAGWEGRGWIGQEMSRCPWEACTGDSLCLSACPWCQPRVEVWGGRRPRGCLPLCARARGGGMGPQTAGTTLSTQAREAAEQLCWTDGAEGQQVKDQFRS